MPAKALETRFLSSPSSSWRQWGAVDPEAGWPLQMIGSPLSLFVQGQRHGRSCPGCI